MDFSGPDQVTIEDFKPLVGTTFLALADPEDLPIRLVAATEGRSGHPRFRAPFALTFASNKEHLLSGGSYYLNSQENGKRYFLAIQPIISAGDEQLYQAVFN